MSNRFSWHSELFPAKLTRNDLVNALEATDLDQLASELHRLSIINANTILSMSTRSKTQQLLTHLDEK